MTDSPDLSPLLERIAAALEAHAPVAMPAFDPQAADAFIWEGTLGYLRPVPEVDALPITALCGIDGVRDTLLANTAQFAAGLPANNALLWGARGMGKSSLIKAVHREVNRTAAGRIALIEVHREELATLPTLLELWRPIDRHAVIYCDDLSFDAGETTYKSLKAVLEGGLAGKPGNVLFYATSNRRHLMPRQVIENERESAIHPTEAVEEKVSLSDRFGLWLGFHGCSQAVYLDIVRAYAKRFALPVETADLERQALQWAQARGARSGRVAAQFIRDLAGRLGVQSDL